jgi:hypothetical protein
MPTESAKQALSILRDSSQFQWYVIPLFVMVLYLYSAEINKKNWNVVFAGFALWGMDWFNEIWNALVFHFTQYAPVWGAPGKTAFLIFIGLNIEICFMFAVMGLAAANVLPADKKMKVFGIPNRLFWAVNFSILCVCVEVILNYIGVLTWDYPWWCRRAPWLIFLFGYFTFFTFSFWVHDMETIKKKFIAVSSLYGFNILCIIVFGVILRWI